jgi:hypothetical protein
MLLPFEATDNYKDKNIDASVRDELSSSYNLTPTAVVITLSDRGLITASECENLLKSIVPKPPSNNTYFRGPKLTTSVEKFCGKITNSNIINGLAEHTLKATRAQYLLFGHIDKVRLHKFKVMNNL